MTTKIVIIGGVAAGTKAAAKARRLSPDAQIDIYTKDTHVSYSSCGLPYYIKGDITDIDELIARSVEEFTNNNIDIHLQHECINIFPEKKQVLIKKYSTGDTITVDYDKLLIATGARPYIPCIKNVDIENVFTLRTLESGIALKEKMEKSAHATIIGGGYIGVELMEAFVHNGLKVAMIEYAPIIMPIFDDDISHIIRTNILQRDWDRVEIVNNDYPLEFSQEKDKVRVKTYQGLDFETDFVVICAGVRPNVELAKAAGIEIGTTGAIKVDSKMRTNKKDIFAAGDCIEEYHVVSRTNAWVPLGSTANKEGRCAAFNMCDIEMEFEGVLGSAVTKYFDFTMSITGLTERTAKLLGFEPVTATVIKPDIVSYMPNAKNITIKLVADKKTRRLLGAQGVGFGNADKRINTVTTGLMCDITVDEFLGNDITYAPPFSPSIDPLLTAAEHLVANLNEAK